MVAFASALSQAIPTQAQLALPPLQRTNNTGVNARPMATPLPGSNLPGIATAEPSTDGSIDRTLMKTGDRSAVVRRPENGTQPATGLDFGKAQLDHRPVAASTQVGEVSLPPVAERSKAPIYVLGAVVVALAGAVAVVATRPQEQVKPVEPTVVKVEPQVVNPPTTNSDAANQALIVLREENARASLGKGRTEFEVAKLDEAETYLKSVAPESSSSDEARALLEKIDTIRQRLKTAQGLRASGKCEQALPLFTAVLALNGKLKDAADGAAACRQSMVSPTME
jgi:hypothetical protein